MILSVFTVGPRISWLGAVEIRLPVHVAVGAGNAGFSSITRLLLGFGQKCSEENRTRTKLSIKKVLYVFLLGPKVSLLEPREKRCRKLPFSNLPTVRKRKKTLSHRLSPCALSWGQCFSHCAAEQSCGMAG